MIARSRIVALVAALAASSMLHAQAPAEPVPEEAAVPASIDLSEIPASAERLLADLALQEERLGGTDVESLLESELEALEAKSLDIQKNKWALRPEGFSNRARGLYKQKWQNLQKKQVLMQY